MLQFIFKRQAQVLALGLAAFAACGGASAQAFPTKPITMIVGFAAGGQTDVQARALANAAARELGQPVIIVNRPGMAATLGPAGMAESAAPDGYTVAVLPATLYRIPHMQTVKYDALKDFTYLINVTAFNFGLVVKADAPWKTVQELVAYAKANPGKVSYGTSGIGGTPHLSIARLAKAAGVSFNMVPFSGGAMVFQNILGGHVDLAAEGGFGSQVDSGKMRVLGLFSDARLPKRPNWPTMKEQGFDVVSQSSWGIGGPKGMDPAIAKTLHDAFRKALTDPEFNRILTLQDQSVTYLNSKDYSAFAAQQLAEEKRYIKEFGIKAE
jgi:tripartite-type tricarboxylate transporter receptor subunit TctC